MTNTAQVLILEVTPEPIRTQGIAYSYQVVLPASAWSTVPRESVDFDSIEDLTRKVKALAIAFGKPCSVTVDCDGRKPSGFSRRFGRSIIANFPSDCVSKAVTQC